MGCYVAGSIHTDLLSSFEVIRSQFCGFGDYLLPMFVSSISLAPQEAKPEHQPFRVEVENHVDLTFGQRYPSGTSFRQVWALTAHVNMQEEVSGELKDSSSPFVPPGWLCFCNL